MKQLEERVCATEVLCQETLAKTAGPSPSPSAAVNPEAVEKRANEVITLARALMTDESRYSRAVSGCGLFGVSVGDFFCRHRIFLWTSQISNCLSVVQQML